MEYQNVNSLMTLWRRVTQCHMAQLCYCHLILQISKFILEWGCQSGFVFWYSISFMKKVHNIKMFFRNTATQSIFTHVQLRIDLIVERVKYTLYTIYRVYSELLKIQNAPCRVQSLVQYNVRIRYSSWNLTPLNT